ncbi:hypothetical protein [Sphaerisporangium perillae]|uniref:hypothetical protein n=1 Tax=Sphaerisporangium perillae TaxID=2935860 RepID=UPI00200E429C|nr:hypothetical protein [Sphaerisporangium perillae]
MVGERNSEPGDLRVFDVNGASTLLRGVIDGHTHDLYNLQDLAVTSDGSMVISAFGSPYRFDAWDTTSLTKSRTYDPEQTDPGFPVAVAVSPEGAHVAGGWKLGTAQGIALYDTAATTTTYATDNPAGEVVRGSIAFSGRDVFGVLRESSTNRLYLWRLEGATAQGSTLTLTAPSAATALEPLTVTGRLTLADGSAPGAQPLVVTRQMAKWHQHDAPRCDNRGRRYLHYHRHPIGRRGDQL